ncbi:MAG TPA: PorV/PorQ family protein [bacterium]|nr:PorV/PorQ family protein [bacterium]
MPGNAKKSLISTILITLGFYAVLCPVPATAQSEPGAIFLLIAPGARAGGMGEAQVAVANDAYATYWNPAGIATTPGREIAAMHMNWLPGLADDIYYEFLAYRHSLGSLGVLGFHGTYLSLGEIVHTGPTGPEALDTFQSYMWNVGISYARQLREHLSLGVSVKYFYQYLAPERVLQQAEGDAAAGNLAVDIGLLHHHLFTRRLSIGMTLSNLGGAITFLDPAQADPAPTRFRIGTRLAVLQTAPVRLALAYDASKVLAARDASGQALPVYQTLFQGWQPPAGESLADQLLHNFGGELWLFDLLALRAGGFYQKAGALHMESGTPMLTLGAGLRFRGLGFDFGYIHGDRTHPLTNTMRFSLQMAF